jgi:two-component system sensor histidine kinase/response regulator
MNRLETEKAQMPPSCRATPREVAIFFAGLVALVATGLAQTMTLASLHDAGPQVRQAIWLSWGGALVGLGFLVLAGCMRYRGMQERRKAAENLEREQNFFRKVLDHLDDGVLAYNDLGEIVYSNRAYQEMYESGRKWSQSGECGIACADCSGKEVCPAEPVALSRILAEDRILEELHVFPEGGVARRLLSVTGKAVRDRDGKAAGAVVELRDVSRQRQAERDLRESEARYRQVVNAMPEGMLMRDRAGRVTAYNENAARMLGLEGEDLLGRTRLPDGWRLESPEGVPLPEDEYPEAVVMRTGVRRSGMLARLVCGDGRSWWLSMNSEPVRLEGDQLPVAVVTTLTDVSDKKRAAEHLERQRSDMEEAQRLARVGSWNWKADGDQVEWSKELFRIVGRDAAAGAVSYRDHASLYTAESWARLSAAVDRTMRNGEPYELELELIREDETTIWVVARGEAERDAECRIIGLRGTLQDITARRKTEQVLRDAKELAEAATRSKSEFLANMSHEIRTPMNGIVGMTSLLLQSDLTGEQRDCLETVRASSEALLGILNDVLDFSKIEAGKLEIERVPFNLERMVEDAIDVVAESAAKKGLELQFFVSGELPAVVLGDSLRLRQILLNFLSNAIKFTERGSVTVLVEPAGDEITNGLGVRFAVSDTGPGLAESEQTKLFQAFSQVDASTTRKHGGTGLGLSISKRLAELMGGKVGVQSLRGEGSTFWFTAQLALSPVPLAVPLSDKALAGKRILVVGSHPMGLLLVRQQLESLGMTMVTARNEAEALAHAEREMPEGLEFAAALVDVDLPGTDAMELIRRMRARAAAAVLPVVLLGTVRDQTLMTEAAGMGSTAYLLKPLRKATLTRALCRLIRRPDGAPLEEPQPISRIEADVLLAEDNVTNQKVATMMLNRFGCRTDVVGNGEEAIQAMRRKRYDVVLMDCQMPVMDGWATAAAIREFQAGQEDRTPIIALTANALSGDRERCLASGMDDYLAKPLSLLQLHAQLTKWAKPSNGTARQPDN